MKRILFVLTLFLFAVAGFGDEKPAATKGHILINNASLEPSFHATNGGYSKFADYCREEGFTINHTQLFHYEMENLQGVDILVSPDPVHALTDTDKQVLKSFIQNGGSILFLVYPLNSDVSNVGSFAKQFGIWVKSKNTSIGKKYGQIVNPLFQTPYPAETIRDDFLFTRRLFLNYDPAKADVVVKAGDNILGCVSKAPLLGKGNLIVIGDHYFAHNNEINNADNRFLIKNIMHFFSGSVDLKVKAVKLKGRNLVAGDTKKVVLKVLNIGDKDSPATTATIYLTDNGNLSVSKTIVELGTFDIPEIVGGKKIKIKENVTLPDWLNFGEYWIVAEVDPAGETGDVDTSNNMKRAKKATILN